MKNKATAILLCFFFGALGAHRFYLRRSGTGFLMLITIGGLGVWTLIDFVRLILISEKDFDLKYNKQ